MGFDLRIHIGELQPMRNEIGSEDSPMWVHELARIELCKPGSKEYKQIHTLIKKSPYCFFYADDGDTKVIKDKYDDRMRAIPAAKVLQILKKNNDDNYCRYTMAIALLEVAVVSGFQNLVVVCYGH